MKVDQESLTTWINALQAPPPRKSGTLVRSVGMTFEAHGITAPLGAMCEVRGDAGERVEAEVVGFADQSLYLMPLTEASGIGLGARVRVVRLREDVELGVGLLGRVIDARGEPLDGQARPNTPHRMSIQGNPVNPLSRGPIHQVLDVGVKAINGVLTMGRGQRMGLIAGSGVGKSVLLGMLTKFTQADVVVIGLIGERGREVQEFISDTLGTEGLAKSVVVAAPANESPILRLKAALRTHTIAEYFRDQGKNVLMLLDSLTRVAHAQREIGLAVGEPPTAKGYPPSVFALIPSLIERAGVGRRGHGAITAVYTVLAEGDDRNDPIVDLARASLDGQIMLSRQLADAAHYPAIDLNGSVSRVLQNIVSERDVRIANRVRRLWSVYQQNEDLIQVGAYEAGTNLDLDEAIRLREPIESFLRQDMNTGISHPHAMLALRRLIGDPL